MAACSWWISQEDNYLAAATTTGEQQRSSRCSTIRSDIIYLTDSLNRTCSAGVRYNIPMVCVFVLNEAVSALANTHLHTHKWADRLEEHIKINRLVTEREVSR